MQDVTFKKLNFHNNPNNDCLTCAGHNFIIEDMIDGKVYFLERTNSYVVRNSDNISYANLGHATRKRSGYVRFYNGNITIGAAEENDNWPLTVKDCSIRIIVKIKLSKCYILHHIPAIFSIISTFC